MNELIHKPWFFMVSIVTVLLCSLGTWSALHDGKPFMSGPQREFSGENRMGSGSLGSGMQDRPRLMSDTATDTDYPTPPATDQ